MPMINKLLLYRNKYSFSPLNNPPKNLFIEITHECNLRCKQCHMWMSKEDTPNALTTDEKLRLIEEFCQMNPRGMVIFSGGETMKKADEFFTLSQKCMDLNLVCFANTNGTLIQDQYVAEKLVRSGPRYLMLSLDSHREEIHDYMRGVPGTYKKVLNAISLLNEAKKKYHVDPEMEILINSIVMDLNYRELRDLIKFARGLDINHIAFQVIGRTFDKRTEKDIMFEKLFPKDKQGFKHEIDKIIMEFSGDPLVSTNENDFNWMKLYVDNPDFMGVQVCASFENNIIVDSYGNAKLCFNMNELFKSKTLDNIKNSSLKDFWTSKNTNKMRAVLSKCRMNCGMLNCHKKRTI